MCFYIVIIADKEQNLNLGRKKTTHPPLAALAWLIGDIYQFV